MPGGLASGLDSLIRLPAVTGAMCLFLAMGRMTPRVATDLHHSIVHLPLAQTTSSFNLATVALRDFCSGDPGRREAFVRALGASLAETGFVKIVDHDVDAALLRAAYAQARAF